MRCHCDSHDCAGYTKTQEVEREVEHFCIPVSRAVTFLHSAMMDGCSSVPRYKQPIPWSIVPAGVRAAPALLVSAIGERNCCAPCGHLWPRSSRFRIKTLADVEPADEVNIVAFGNLTLRQHPGPHFARVFVFGEGRARGRQALRPDSHRAGRRPARRHPPQGAYPSAALAGDCAGVTNPAAYNLVHFNLTARFGLKTVICSTQATDKCDRSSSSPG